MAQISVISKELLVKNQGRKKKKLRSFYKLSFQQTDPSSPTNNRSVQKTLRSKPSVHLCHLFMNIHFQFVLTFWRAVFHSSHALREKHETVAERVRNVE